MELNQIVTGDCREELPRIATGSAPLIINDPPYGIGYDYGEAYSDTLSPAEYEAFSYDWLRQCYRILSPTGTFWLIIGEAWQAELKVMCRKLGFHHRSTVIWHVTFGANCDRKFTPSHVHCFYFTKHKTDFTFNADQLKVMSSRQLAGDKRAKPGGRLPNDFWVLRPQELGQAAFPAGGDAWCISRICGTYAERMDGAKTQLPERLVGRIVMGCSNPGDLVVDPMTGVGTIPAVAKKLGRQYIGIEQAETFAATARQRLAAIKPGDALAGPAPQGG